MKLLLGLLGVVAALTYGAVTLIGAAPVGSLSAPVQLNVPLQTQGRAPVAVASTATPAVTATVEPPAAPAIAAAVVNPNEPSPSCDLPFMLAQLMAARKQGHLAIVQVAPELARAGCSAASVAAIAAQVDPPNAGRWRGGDHSGTGDGHEGGD